MTSYEHITYKNKRTNTIRMTFTGKELSAEIFRRTRKSMTPEELWNYAVENSLDKETSVSGKTPWRTLGAQIYDDISKRPDTTQFCVVSKKPTRFYLKDLVVNGPAVEVVTKVPASNERIKEKDLHPFLVSFVKNDPHFYCYSKTIREGAGKSNYKHQNEWMYPDIVGVHYPFDDDYDSDAYELFESLKQNSVKIYSFELKLHISPSDVREKYFQAISNSSWANEGYLVAKSIDDDAIEELRSLTCSFGIGVIRLNLDDVAQSEILFPSKVRSNLDEEIVSRLANNGDFREFVSRINKNIKARDVNKAGYDDVLDEDDLKTGLSKILH